MKAAALVTSALPLLMPLLLSACGEAGRGAGGGWQGSLDTLPDGAVRVVNPSTGLWTETGGWRLVPELTIGDVEGPEATVFAAIAGLQVDDDGTIHVLDRQVNELRTFAPDGRHLRSVGRSGEGPGEYVAANGLLWLAPDTLLVADQRGERYTVLTSEGETVRTVPRRLGHYGWTLRGGLFRGRLYEEGSILTDPDWRPASIQDEPDFRRVLLGVSLNPDTLQARVDTVLLPEPRLLYEDLSVRSERGGITMAMPFAPRPIYHLDSEGGIWHGYGSEFRIFRSTFEGDTVLEITLAATPAPVTPAEVQEWSGSDFVQRFRELGGRVDLERIPRTKPFFDGLYLDPDRHLWVSVPTEPLETVSAIFDPEGRYLGRLELQGFELDRFVPPVVRNGRLYLVGRDELDVQRVHVFRIEGRSAEASDAPRAPEPRASLFSERVFAGFAVGAAALLLAEVAEPDAENLPFALYPGAVLGGVAMAAAAREGVRLGPLALGTAVGSVPWLIAWNLDRHGQETSLLFGVIGVVTVPLGAAVGQGLGSAMPTDQGLRELPPYAPR